MEEIDRESVPPFLLRLFWNVNRNNTSAEYEHVKSGKYPSNEVQIYTWRNATLKEIADIVKDVVPAAKQRLSSLQMSIVYQDRNGHHCVRQVGLLTSRPGPDDNKTFASLNFETGDFLDVGIMSPRSSANR